MDLTQADPVGTGQAGTRIDAPARFAKGLWTVDQIPPERLLAPLVVLDVAEKAQQIPNYRISVEDIARWERTNGQIPLGSVVVARTRINSSPMASSEFAAETAQFLVQGRNVTGLGSDASSLESRRSNSESADKFALSHSVYVLKNVASLERVPASGALVMVAPTKLRGRTEAPARIIALVR